mgnify:CR=1 FL=1
MHPLVHQRTAPIHTPRPLPLGVGAIIVALFPEPGHVAVQTDQLAQPSGLNGLHNPPVQRFEAGLKNTGDLHPVPLARLG